MFEESQNQSLGGTYPVPGESNFYVARGIALSGKVQGRWLRAGAFCIVRKENFAQLYIYGSHDHHLTFCSTVLKKYIPPGNAALIKFSKSQLVHQPQGQSRMLQHMVEAQVLNLIFRGVDLVIRVLEI